MEKIKLTKREYVGDGVTSPFLPVDSETGMLFDKEFTFANGSYFVCEINEINLPGVTEYSEEEFNTKFIWQ